MVPITLIRYLPGICGNRVVAKVSLIEDMRTKMKRAERGALEFGTGRQFDVDLIESSRITLEIRLIDHEIPDPSGASDESVQRHTRVYFTEPEHLDGCLLALSVQSKCPGPEGLDEQDRHAAAAALRAEDHCARM